MEYHGNNITRPHARTQWRLIWNVKYIHMWLPWKFLKQRHIFPAYLCNDYDISSISHVWLFSLIVRKIQDDLWIHFHGMQACNLLFLHSSSVVVISKENKDLNIYQILVHYSSISILSECFGRTYCPEKQTGSHINASLWKIYQWRCIQISLMKRTMLIFSSPAHARVFRVAPTTSNRGVKPCNWFRVRMFFDRT